MSVNDFNSTGTRVDPTPFRSFSEEAFKATPTWLRLDHILTGNGGAYGFYGTRGSGKSWLMLKAIGQVNSNKGMGMWFPCPSEYGASAFLSSLSDNLASVVERRFIRDNFWSSALRQLQFGLFCIVFAPIVVAIVTYTVHGLNAKLTSSTVFSTLPSWLWLIVGIAIALLFVLFAYQILRATSPIGRLAREATALRERIRFTTALKLGAEIGVSGGSRVTGSLKRSQERSLDERPTTVASLVFDFRNLAEFVVKTIKQPLVIGIDELDKIEDPQAVRKLLSDIKGTLGRQADVYFLYLLARRRRLHCNLGHCKGEAVTNSIAPFIPCLNCRHCPRGDHRTS